MIGQSSYQHLQTLQLTSFHISLVEEHGKESEQWLFHQSEECENRVMQQDRVDLFLKKKNKLNKFKIKKFNSKIYSVASIFPFVYFVALFTVYPQCKIQLSLIL